MQMKEIARELQGKAANLALRMPISWVNILAGPPITVDGRTLDTPHPVVPAAAGAQRPAAARTGSACRRRAPSSTSSSP